MQHICASAEPRSPLEHPDQADYTVQFARDRFLAMSGDRLTSQDAALLLVFLEELGIRRERAVLDALGPTRTIT